jgi:hypothetical protein
VGGYAHLLEYDVFFSELPIADSQKKQLSLYE